MLRFAQGLDRSSTPLLTRNLDTLQNRYESDVGRVKALELDAGVFVKQVKLKRTNPVYQEGVQEITRQLCSIVS